MVDLFVLTHHVSDSVTDNAVGNRVHVAQQPPVKQTVKALCDCAFTDRLKELGKLDEFAL